MSVENSLFGLGFATNDEVDRKINALRNQQRRYVNSAMAKQNNDISNYASVAKQCELLTDGITAVSLNQVNKSVNFQNVVNSAAPQGRAAKSDVNCIQIVPKYKRIQNVNGLGFTDTSFMSGITDDIDNEDPTKAVSIAAVKDINEQVQAVKEVNERQDEEIANKADNSEFQAHMLSSNRAINMAQSQATTALARHAENTEKITAINETMDQHLGRITTLEGTVGYLGKIHWELKNDYDINMEDVKGRVEYLESSFSGFFDIMYPIGSIYMSMIKSPPPIGVWVLITGGRFLRSTTYDDDGGVEGGSNQFHLSEVNLPPHKHWFAGDEMTGRFHIRSSKHETINSCYGVFSKNGRGDVVWKTNLMHNSDDIEGCMTYEEVGFKATPSGTIGETGQGVPLSLPNPPYITCYMYKRVE